MLILLLRLFLRYQSSSSDYSSGWGICYPLLRSWVAIQALSVLPSLLLVRGAWVVLRGKAAQRE
ncbi:hypothetical protein L804_03428 [Cryptococcus deuterogattii 2001/935-1]|nr:hypothetical protein I352_05945 [Cryptococcus deuterogattii MMRL2647]KIR98812.1 hypothetical protein L804_03428 [Cryptococcus deuterogattii 2001/935-1]